MKKTLTFLCFVALATSLRAQSITIQPLTDLTYCSGGSGTVMFQSSGSFNSDNVFEVQLSDSGSNFSSWTIIGRTSALSGSIPVTFTQPGYFRVRVASTDPLIYSKDNGEDFRVVGPPTPHVYAYRSDTELLTIYNGSGTGEFFGVQEDSIQFSDQYDDSAVRYEWSFNQDASIKSSTDANPTVYWYSGGIKTGSLSTWNSEGCTSTESFSIRLQSCDPVIPADAHIVTGTERGDYQDVWIKPGAIYSGGAGGAYIEPGGEMLVQDLGGWTAADIYVKRGGSLFIASNENVYIAVMDTGASTTNIWNASYRLYCDSLQFDYSKIAPNGVENSQPSTISILQSSDKLFASAENSLVSVHISNLLGTEVLSKQGASELDIDLSSLPVGIYFAVVRAGGEEVVRKIAVVQ